MPEPTVQPATSPAAADPSAQTGAANQNAGNLTASQFARRFLEAKPSEPATAEQTTSEPTPAASTSAAGAEQSATAEAETKQPEAENPQAEGGEEAADTDLSQKTTLTPEQQAAVNRRVGREQAKTKRALERAATAEARLQALEQQAAQPPAAETKPQVVPLPSGSPPLANIENVQDLSAVQQQAKEAVRWAEELLETEGIENGVRVGDQVFSKADLREIRRNAKVTLEDHIPARVQFLQQRNQWQQQAYAEFPFLKDKTSEDYHMVQAIYKDMPWLRNVPNGDWIAGLGVEGWKALQARKAAAQKPKETPKAEPPKPPASQAAVSAGSSVRTAASATKAQTVGEAFKSKGGVSGSEFARFLAQKDLARNTR